MGLTSLLGDMGYEMATALLPGFFAVLGLPAAAQAPEPTSVPNGLPSWAYNIPDKVQPPATPLKGTIRVPGSAKEFDAAQGRSTTSPPDWFPDEHPQAPGIDAGARPLPRG